jgi:TonB family protein
MTHHTTRNRLRRAAAAAAASLALIFSLPAAARAQDPADDFERGKQLLARGDAGGAAAALKRAAESRKADADAWYFYGLALYSSAEARKARQAFERAVKLRPDSAQARGGLSAALLSLDKLRDAEREAARALALDDKVILAHYVVGSILLRLYAAESERVSEQHPMPEKASEATRAPVFERREAALAPLKARMRAAAERLDTLAAAPPGGALTREARELADTLRVYGSGPGNWPANVFRQAEVTTRAVINHKPEPGYIEEVRRPTASGVVRLRAVLAADGRVKNILVIKGMPDGLTERAIEAARRIKFTPAAINGRPVSQVVILEYNFNVY